MSNAHENDSSPTEPSATPSPIPAAAPQRSWRGSRHRLIGLIIYTVVVALVLALLLKQFGVSGGAAVPSNWQTFHDPAGYFTIGLPPGWTATSGTNGNSTLGGPTGSYTSIDYNWTLRDSAGPGVFISYHTLPNATARQLECEDFSSNTTFDGVLASCFGDYPEWLIFTNAAHYQLDYGFPTDPTGHQFDPTPIPAATATAGIDLSSRVAATFAPIPATPLSC